MSPETWFTLNTFILAIPRLFPTLCFSPSSFSILVHLSDLFQRAYSSLSATFLLVLPPNILGNRFTLNQNQPSNGRLNKPWKLKGRRSQKKKIISDTL